MIVPFTMPSRTIPKKFAPVMLVATLALGACAAPPAGGINDPAERVNRQIHAFNVGADRVLVRPAARAYGAVVPDPLERGVQNVAGNFDQPAYVVNDLLQGRPGDALHNGVRFAMNTLLGIGGVFDVATGMGIPARETDFGETLSVWGVGEGAFVMLPVLGPSTARDATGRVVDTLANPLSAIRVGVSSPREIGRVSTAAEIGSRLGERNRFSATIDQLLYDSADGYAQLRLLYLQNRRFELGRAEAGLGDDAAIDPYEDNAAATPPDADAIDPYEDPYAQ